MPPENRFEAAVHFAMQVHEGHYHKGSTIPYLSHLWGVTSIAMENGATEEEAIGALLHDSLERQIKLKQDIPAFLSDLLSRFGAGVRAIVEGCSDCRDWPKPPWKDRKQFFLDSLSTASPSVLLVSLSDKLHNAQTAWWDYGREGEAIWELYKGKQAGTLWYYRALVTAYRQRLADPAFDALLPAERHRDLAVMLTALDELVCRLEGTRLN